MAPYESPSSAANVLVNVICDPKVTLELMAEAADLIALGARANAAFLSAKGLPTEKPGSYYLRIASVYHTVSSELVRAWEERKRTGDLSGVAAVIRTMTDELRAAMAG